nr:helix-turn-helix transcriptional regulator [Planosporangium thailandense]
MVGVGTEDLGNDWDDEAPSVLRTVGTDAGAATRLTPLAGGGAASAGTARGGERRRAVAGDRRPSALWSTEPDRRVDEDSVQRLATGLLGAPPARDLRDLLGAAAGDSSLVLALLGGLWEQSALAYGPDGVSLTSPELPWRVREMVERWLARLSPAARHVAAVAAVVGKSFLVSDLTVLLGRTTAELLPVLQELHEGGVLEPVAERLAFRQELVRRVAIESIPSPVLAALRHEVDERRRDAAPSAMPGGEPRAGGEADEGCRPTLDLVVGGPCRTTGGTEATEGTCRPLALAGRSRSEDPWSGLNERERDVARLANQGLTNRQIAGRMHLSPHTVNYYLRRIYRKLGINSRVQLAAYGIGRAG